MTLEGKWIKTTAELADLFHVSERQIQRLVAAGVIEPVSDEKPFRFDLDIVVAQYANFLQSGIPMSKWAPDA